VYVKKESIQRGITMKKLILSEVDYEREVASSAQTLLPGERIASLPTGEIVSGALVATSKIISSLFSGLFQDRFSVVFACRQRRNCPDCKALMRLMKKESKIRFFRTFWRSLMEAKTAMKNLGGKDAERPRKHSTQSVERNSFFPSKFRVFGSRWRVWMLVKWLRINEFERRFSKNSQLILRAFSRGSQGVSAGSQPIFSKRFAPSADVNAQL
jgi:hypothetical protein